jgi:hypothetical protein
MALELIPSKRGTKVLLDDNHVKTIAKKYSLVFNKVNHKMTFDKKRLTDNERRLLEIQLHWHNYIKKLASSNKHLYELIKNASPTAARKVITHSGERMEIVLDNNIRINTENTRFFSLFPHTSDHYQNF